MHTNRRDLLLAGACAASTALFWSVAARLRAEGPNPPPETTTIRLAKNPSICIAPQYVVSDLLNAEGFTNVVYVQSDAGVEQTKAVGKGDLDFTLHFSGPLLLRDRSGLEHYPSGRDSCRLLRAIRQGGHTQRRRSEGSNRRHSGA